jgi:drug/metabolite transporter (DMT)-like permease
MKDWQKKWHGVLAAIVAAVLFGASTPLAKQLLPEVKPWLLAGLLYLGSGLGLMIYRSIRPGRKTGAETALSRHDAPWLAGAILCGGIVGPVLLMFGLNHTPASSASLILNLEGVLTALLAWFVFKENFDARIAWGMAFITAGAVVLSWMGQVEWRFPWGAVAIVGACAAWALDNNLTRKVSAADPAQIAMIKGLCAGSVNTALALFYGAKLPGVGILVATGVVGFLGYGVSLALFVLALRHLGTARTGAYFSLAPFVGAIVSIALLNDPITTGFVVGSLLMAVGVWLHLTERHLHDHSHEVLVHEHLHHHDEHHQHTHSPTDPVGEPHSHGHRHEPLVHTHEHYPDLHHRHPH